MCKHRGALKALDLVGECAPNIPTNALDTQLCSEALALDGQVREVVLADDSNGTCRVDAELIQQLLLLPS